MLIDRNFYRYVNEVCNLSKSNRNKNKHNKIRVFIFIFKILLIKKGSKQI